MHDSELPAATVTTAVEATAMVSLRPHVMPSKVRTTGGAGIRLGTADSTVHGHSGVTRDSHISATELSVAAKPAAASELLPRIARDLPTVFYNPIKVSSGAFTKNVMTIADHPTGGTGHAGGSPEKISTSSLPGAREPMNPNWTSGRGNHRSGAHIGHPRRVASSSSTATVKRNGAAVHTPTSRPGARLWAPAAADQRGRKQSIRAGGPGVASRGSRSSRKGLRLKIAP